MPAIRERHAEIEKLIGEPLDLPEVGDPAILEYFLVEDDGKVVGGMYLEKSVRMCFIGISPKATAALRALEEQILLSSKEAGVRFVHCSISVAIPAADNISRHLRESGFDARPDLLDHMKDLR